MRKSTTTSIIAGAGAGTAAVFMLREYVDKTQPPLPLPLPEGWNTYSTVVGITGGAIATLAGGLYPAMTGKSFFSDDINAFLTSMGVTMLTGGILSGLFPSIPSSPQTGLVVPSSPTVTIVPRVKPTSEEILA